MVTIKLTCSKGLSIVDNFRKTLSVVINQRLSWVQCFAQKGWYGLLYAKEEVACCLVLWKQLNHGGYWNHAAAAAKNNSCDAPWVLFREARRFPPLGSKSSFSLSFDIEEYDAKIGKAV